MQSEHKIIHMGRRCRIVMCLLSLGVVLLAGCQGEKGGDEGVLNSMFGPSPSEVARQAFSMHDADARRRAVLMLSNAEWGGEEPYLRTYRLLVDDPDPTVRAASLRALGQHGKIEDVSLILPYLQDQSKLVRWEAAKALQRFHHEAAIDPLIQALRQDEDTDVRIAAATALAQYPTPPVFQALVGALNDDNFGVVRASQEALQTLTGKNLGHDGSRWLAWAEKTPNLFQDQQTYYYPQYEAPRRWWKKVKFWNRPEPVDPQLPRGQAEGQSSRSSAS